MFSKNRRASYTATACTPRCDEPGAFAWAAESYPCCPQLGRLDMFPFTVLDIGSTVLFGEEREAAGGEEIKEKIGDGENASSALEAFFQQADCARQTSCPEPPTHRRMRRLRLIFVTRTEGDKANGDHGTNDELHVGMITHPLSDYPPSPYPRRRARNNQP